MKLCRLILLALCGVSCSSTILLAQPRTVGPWNLTTTTCGSGTNGDPGCMVINTTAVGGAGISVQGTFTGTIQFEGTIDNSNWTPVNMFPTNSTTAATSTTGTGVWNGGVGGLLYLRARMSAYTSGAATLIMKTAPTTGRNAPPNGGGGGGALLAVNNLSDVNSAATSAHNLGLGTTDNPTFASVTTGGTGPDTYTAVADPGSPVLGQFWLSSTTAGRFKYTDNGPTIRTLVGSATTDTLTNKTLNATSDVLGGVTMTLGSDGTGDIWYRNSSGVLTRLAAGSNGQHLYVVSGLPSWRGGPGTVASSATPTINTDNTSFFSITALAVAITSFTTNLSGTPFDGQSLVIRIVDNGTPRAITWGASFIARGVALPTTTVANKVLLVGFVWNAVNSTWDCSAVDNEA